MVVAQLSVAVAPAVMLVGETDMVAVGSGVGGGETVTVTVL